MTVLCGNCKQHHQNAAAVASCYRREHGREVASFRRKVEDTVNSETSREDGMTAKQRDFIDALRRERGLEPLDFNNFVSKREASKIISYLFSIPRKVHEDLPKVADGHYALRVEEKTDLITSILPTVVKFFKVRNPTEGQWAGRTFVDVQAGNEFYPVKPVAAKREVLKRIAEDPEMAMTLYGRELGQCGYCGRTLTNEESRARGIGPVCAEKMGW